MYSAVQVKMNTLCSVSVCIRRLPPVFKKYKVKAEKNDEGVNIFCYLSGIH